ncbi:IclR family transcriptional regulator [Paenibacillus sp. URB8-2]|uniref:IclR family transcriptional regulator n=1 Tax=Paenibacillus sp. URB8-2 TaxID=2741301 RepID=UPI0015BF4B8B|nr:IclR family transcriptional regulator [Paenibacillus sp. URB8-2]BCG58795.1 IclR family transcriptional regulator [Paenibacillus sp. URB8-2]
MDQYEVATLKKGLLILEALREGQPMTLTEIMRIFQLNKSTTFRLLHTLENAGYIEKEDRSYRVTDKLGRTPAASNPRLDWLAVPPLNQLAQEVGETLYVGILHDLHVVTTQVVEGTHTMRIHSQVGDSSYAHLSAFGKVILAHLDEARREEILSRLTLHKNTENTFSDMHLLREHLKVIRRQGYAVDDEETEVGLRCIAAPIYYDDAVIAAVALAGPAARLTKKKDRALSKRLLECSAQISRKL